MKKEKDKWVDVSNLPKIKNKRIDWKNSVGYKIKFQYKNLSGELIILNYEKGYVEIKYLNNPPFNIQTGNLLNCKLGNLTKSINYNFNPYIGNRFKDDSRDITIIKISHKRNKQGVYNYFYKYYCNKCGNEDWITRGSLSDGVGCNVCCPSPRKVVLGINTIWDKARWMIDLGVSEEDAKKYTPNCNKKIKVICPDCGSKKYITPNNIFKNCSISCSCGDGTSYPEKIVISLLNQLKVNYIKEYSPDWIDKKRYDFYFKLNNEEYIIEAHGRQHYENSIDFKSSSQEQQENDSYKKENAVKNGIKENNYIVLDCRESSLEWVKNSIINSRLNELFNLNSIDWMECEKFTFKNIVKEVCDYWKIHNDINNEKITISQINKKFNIGSAVKYLQKGKELGWCNYSPQYSNNIKIENSKRKVEVLKDGISYGVFDSIMEIERRSEELFGLQLRNGCISLVANGKQKHHKGFEFKFV